MVLERIKCSLPMNRGFPLIQVTNTKIMWTFFGDQTLCSLNGGVSLEQ